MVKGIDEYITAEEEWKGDPLDTSLKYQR